LYSDGILEDGLYTDGSLDPFISDLMVLRGRSSSSYSGSAESGGSGRLDCPGIFEAGRSDAVGRAENTGRIEEAAGTLEGSLLASGLDDMMCNCGCYELYLDVKWGRKLLRDEKYNVASKISLVFK